jgi:iron complex outermembrane receptor protein
LGLTYFHTNFADLISGSTPLSLNILQDPSLAWLLRPTTAAEQTYVCEHSLFAGVRSDCLSARLGAIVDLRLQNVASLQTQGLDIAAQYEFDQAQSIWKLGVNTTYVFQYTEQQSPSTPRRNLVSTDHNPIDLRLRASLSWARCGLWARGFVNFQNSYEDIDSTPNRPISSWTTVDAAVGYDVRLAKIDSTEKTRFSISARNVFNHQPPFLNSQYGIGYDQENANLVGRVISFDIRQHW